MENRSNGLPKLEDVETFSRDTWITEREGVSRARAARTGETPGRMFRRRRARSFLRRSAKS